MASFVPHGDGWRAHVYVRGERDSATFATKREAKQWAQTREEELRAKAGASGVTFEQAAERWFKVRLPDLSRAEDQTTIENAIRKYALPALGPKRLADIRRVDLVAVVEARRAKDGKIEAARRLGRSIARILQFAVNEGHIESHAARDLGSVLPKRAKGRMAAVKVEEVPALLRAIQTFPSRPTTLALMLMAHTFVRASELMGAQWEEFIIKEKAWVIAAPRMKMGLPHVVPLSRQVLAMLAELRESSAGSPWVLLSPYEAGTHMHRNTPLYALYDLGYRRRQSLHGFRAIASSILNQSKKWSRDAIERQLAHKESDQIREAYHRAEYFEERVAMLQWYSDHLDSLLASAKPAAP